MKNMPKVVEVKILELLNVCNEQNVSISGVVEVNNGNIINFSCINELHSTELNQIQTLNSVKGELELFLLELSKKHGFIENTMDKNCQLH